MKYLLKRVILTIIDQYSPILLAYLQYSYRSTLNQLRNTSVVTTCLYNYSIIMIMWFIRSDLVYYHNNNIQAVHVVKLHNFYNQRLNKLKTVTKSDVM